MEQENIDLNGFVISHSTDSQCAASLFQAAHGEGSVDPGDIELSRIVQFGEGGGWAHFAFFIGKRIVCCCAHSVPLTDAILEDARGFRIRMLMLFAERHPDMMEWPMEVEQFGAPMSKELMDQGIALIRGQSEDDDMLGRLKDMNSVYTYNGTEELTEDELDSIPGEKVRVIAVEKIRGILRCLLMNACIRRWDTMTGNSGDGFSGHDCIPIFHGSVTEIRPEDFNFNLAREDNDFGKAIYFSTTYEQARRWALKYHDGRINMYLMHYRDAIANGTKIKEFDDRREWLDTILSTIDDDYHGDYDIFIGPIMDARTMAVLNLYARKASKMGLTISELPQDIKDEMISDLKPERLDRQLAFRNKKALRCLEFMKSLEAKETTAVTKHDPSETAAKVAKLIMERDGLDQDEAIKRIMLSETFEKLTSDMSLWDAEPEFLLAMYDEEAARCTITTAPKKM